jgi:hypothetical protein
MKDDNTVEKLMLDLVYGGHAGWAAAEVNHLQRLGARELVEACGREVRASDHLFD